MMGVHMRGWRGRVGGFVAAAIVGCCGIGCGDEAGSGGGGFGGGGGLGTDAGTHTVTLVNHCRQPVWVASNEASPERPSDWALAPTCDSDAECADGQTCSEHACTCSADSDCAFQTPSGTPAARCDLESGRCTSSATVDVSPGWSGRFWARTECSGAEDAFVCATGQCGPDSGSDFDCAATAATANRATLFELSAAGTSGIDNFDVSLVSGYNVPVVVTVELPEDHATWKPDTDYAAGAQILEMVGEHNFGFTAAGKPGRSGMTKPDFPATWTDSVSDGADLRWVNVGPQCERSGCESDLLTTCPPALQVKSGNSVVACDAPANQCVDSMASCHDELSYYQCQNNGGPKDLFGNVLDLQSPNADTYVCFSADDCPPGTTCELDPEFVSGFTMPQGTGLCLPVTQNGGCAPGDEGKPCPLRTYPFVDYQCQTLTGRASNAQVCIPPTSGGFGDLWWNSANWSEVIPKRSCTADAGCAAGDKCLSQPFMGGSKECATGDASCSCHTPKRCGTADSGANGGCPGPRQCLNDVGAPNGGDVDCTKETCYCGPQAIFSSTCGPTNPDWQRAEAAVGNWATVFKEACPVAYSYQYDDPSSNWSCPNPADDLVDYRVEFCFAPSSP